MRRLTILMLLMTGLTLVSPLPTSAADLQVEGSEGTTEALIPGVGWRRAVLGRTIPPESVVTTWLDSQVTLSTEGMALQVGPLTHLGLSGGEVFGFTLAAGQIAVQSEGGVIIKIPLKNVTVESEGPARFRVNTKVVSVQEGSVSLSFADGASRVVTAGRSASLIGHSLVPIIIAP